MAPAIAFLPVDEGTISAKSLPPIVVEEARQQRRPRQQRLRPQRQRPQHLPLAAPAFTPGKIPLASGFPLTLARACVLAHRNQATRDLTTAKPWVILALKGR